MSLNNDSTIDYSETMSLVLDVGHGSD